jgi:O-antigen ligase
LINHPNNYLPFVDLITYCFAILTICVLTPYLKQLDGDKRQKIIFVPLTYGVIVSALWGIFQSLTGIGLSETTLEYRRASFGFGAQGFQPDIHSFAAIMLIGTIGVLGFLREARGRDFYLCCFCIAISWVALVLSKSKASLLFALLTSASFMILQFRVKGMKVKKIFFYFLISLISLSVLFFLTKSFVWIDYFTELLFAPGNSIASNINKALVYRPELFRAALLMFADSPIFGVGLGNFFRLSTNLDLTHSLYMAQNGGENAHNYFLQTLAETGMVGASAFIFAMSWPFLKSNRPLKAIVPGMALLSIALGNIFSHSLIIRPNLILLAVFLALTYASVLSTGPKSNSQRKM